MFMSYYYLFLDPRVKDWPMCSSPLPTLAACICYAYCAKVVGPRLMANRKPFELRNVLIVYNFAQTIFSAWIFYEVIHILLLFTSCTPTGTPT